MLYATTNHLTEAVKRIMGGPAGRILHDRLLLEAKRLLRYSDLPIGPDGKRSVAEGEFLFRCRMAFCWKCAVLSGFSWQSKC